MSERFARTNQWGSNALVREPQSDDGVRFLECRFDLKRLGGSEVVGETEGCGRRREAQVARSTPVLAAPTIF